MFKGVERIFNSFELTFKAFERKKTSRRSNKFY